jgi:hypothetical protein
MSPTISQELSVRNFSTLGRRFISIKAITEKVGRGLKVFSDNEIILVGGGGEVKIDPTHFFLLTASNALRRPTNLTICGLREQ